MAINRADFCVGARLIRSRKAAGLSQLEVARMLNVTRKTVSLWERGLTDIGYNQLINWSYATQTPFEYLALGVAPLKAALAQIKEMRRANNDAITNAYKMAHSNSKKMEADYLAAWSARFEDYN